MSAPSNPRRWGRALAGAALGAVALVAAGQAYARVGGT